MSLVLIDLAGTHLSPDERALLANEPIAGVCLFAGYWLMNARVVDALGVETEEPFVGWDLANV